MDQNFPDNDSAHKPKIRNVRWSCNLYKYSLKSLITVHWYYYCCLLLWVIGKKLFLVNFISDSSFSYLSQLVHSLSCTSDNTFPSVLYHVTSFLSILYSLPSSSFSIRLTITSDRPTSNNSSRISSKSSFLSVLLWIAHSLSVLPNFSLPL